MYCVLYGSLRTVGSFKAVVLLRNMNREYIAGPYKLDLGLLVGLALSIGGFPRQPALRERSNGSAFVLFSRCSTWKLQPLVAVSALSVDTLLLSKELRNMGSMHCYMEYPLSLLSSTCFSLICTVLRRWTGYLMHQFGLLHLLPSSFFGTHFLFLLELSIATDHTQYF